MLASPAAAAVTAATPQGFTLIIEQEVRGSPAAAWATLTDWGSWWDGAHSYSGKASNLTLDLRGGGCLCERWAGGEVAHGRVLMARSPRTLRMDAPFGPLQALPGTAVMSFELVPAGTGTRIVLTLRAAGDAADGYDKLAPLVDAVLTGAAARLARRIDPPPR